VVEEDLPLIVPGQAVNTPDSIDLNGHIAQIRDLIRSVRENRQPAVHPREGRKPVDIILAIYESSRCNEAVILEDDCLPDPTFFQFCDEMLERYRDEPRVMHIGGTNFQLGRRPTSDSYYFSAINQIWGWATWSRAWRGHYDVTMQRWPDMRDTSMLTDLVGEEVAAKVKVGFDNIHAGKTDSWDNQWTLAMWLAQGLAVLPAVNLISNIGFGPDATHTKKANSGIANQPTEPIEFPLRHPAHIARNRAADDQAYRNMILCKAM
jgi:hypothetical protein